jgi:hypothetical protein
MGCVAIIRLHLEMARFAADPKGRSRGSGLRSSEKIIFSNSGPKGQGVTCFQFPFHTWCHRRDLGFTGSSIRVCIRSEVGNIKDVPQALDRKLGGTHGTFVFHTLQNMV